MRFNLLTRWCWRGASVAPVQEDDVPNDNGRGRARSRANNNFEEDGDDSQLEAAALRGRNRYNNSSSRLKWCRTFVMVVGVVAIIAVIGYFCRDYIRKIVLWMSGQEVWVVILVFLALYTIVSFPFTWGYIVINVAAGYMFGTWKGLGLTMGTVTFSIIFAHTVIRGCFREFFHRQVLKSRVVAALLTVLSGTHAFKVIAVTRLTPIPFGLQNAVFSVSGVPTILYMTATILGLLPTQILNCYLGTTVRNLQDVVSESSSASATGWIIFSVQIAISIALTFWVVRRAKAELQKTMNAELLQSNRESLDPEEDGSPKRASTVHNTPSGTPFQNGSHPTTIANTVVVPTPLPCSIRQPACNLNSPCNLEDCISPISIQTQKQVQEEQKDQQEQQSPHVHKQQLPNHINSCLNMSQSPRRVHSSNPHLNYMAVSVYNCEASQNHLMPSPIHQQIFKYNLKNKSSDHLCGVDLCEGSYTLCYHKINQNRPITPTIPTTGLILTALPWKQEA